MFIVFEGIDNSGKTTLSKLFTDYLNSEESKELISKCYRDKDDYMVASLGGFTWTKEPTFTTEESDRLNSSEMKCEFKRESLFFSDRFRHLNLLKEGFVVCDRYVWTGLAYALKFAPNAFKMVKYLYTDPSIFPVPDLHIFVDTPIELCDSRDRSVGIDRLRDLRYSYLETKGLYAKEDATIVVRASKPPEESLAALIGLFKEWVISKKGLL